MLGPSESVVPLLHEGPPTSRGAGARGGWGVCAGGCWRGCAGAQTSTTSIVTVRGLQAAAAPGQVEVLQAGSSPRPGELCMGGLVPPSKGVGSWSPPPCTEEGLSISSICTGGR